MVDAAAQHRDVSRGYMSMKSRWSIAAGALAAAMVTAGCGAGGTAGNNAANASGVPANTAGSQVSAKVSFPLTVTDQAGHKVTIPNKPERIASGTLGTDEILSGLVPKSEIVLVTQNATDPSQSNIVSFAKGIPAMKDANAEAIIAQHPDLALLASYTKPGVVQQVEQAGIPTYEFSDFDSIQAIEHNIEVVGELVGEPQKAQQMVEGLEQRLAAIKNAVRNQAHPRVLNYSSYGYVAGAGTTVNDVIVDAGGVNAAGNLKGWQQVTPEQVVKMNPDVIIVSADDAGFKDKLLHDPKYQTINAVKNHRVYEIPAADLMSLSQYVYKGVEDVARVLYPNVKLPQ
jgi:iron complex transport system substrate-binding protein